MTNKEIVQSAFENFGKGNIAGIMDIMSDDIVWNMSGPDIIPFAGHRRGKAEVMDFFAQIAGSQNMEKFEPQSFVSEGDRVVAFGVAVATSKKTGKRATNNWAMSWLFKDGKAIEYNNYSDTYALAESFM
jgi:ketosteroid isomerase-like protein